MSRTFTYKYFKSFYRVSIIAVVICISAFNMPAKPEVLSGADRALQVKTIKCYPNPAISFINFEFPSEYVSRNYSLQVYSFTGRKMYESGVTGPKALLTFTNEFYRGIYVYQLQDKTGKILETGKFQVNR
jgi:hypothetical protein